MTVVCCLFVRGEYPYTPEYVHRLYAMASRWITTPFQFYCLTDRPELFSSPIARIPVKRLAGFAYWTKLLMFHPAMRWDDVCDRVVYLDLDTLIVSDLAPVLAYDRAISGLAITDDPETRPKPRTRDAFGRRIIRKVNSSVMVWDAWRTPTELFTFWTPDVVKRLSGDQDWIAECLPMASRMPRAWFPRLSECRLPLHHDEDQRVAWPEESKVILCKVPKNHIAAEDSPAFAKIWRAA